MTTLAAKIVSLLIDIARAIGRWVVKRLANLGMKRGVAWIEGRIGVFRKRLARAVKNGWALRERWLDGRISRWLRARAWILKNQKKIEDKAVRAYCKLSDTALAKVPYYAPAELCPADVRAEAA